MESNIGEILDKLNRFDQVPFKRLEGYKLGRYFSVSYDEIIGNYQSEKNSILLFLKIIARCFVRDYNYGFDSIPSGKIILFYSHEHARRSDYVKFMDDMQYILEDSYLFSGVDTTKKIVFGRQSIQNLFLLRDWYKKIKTIEKSTNSALLLLSKVSMGYRWKQFLDKNWNQHLSGMIGLVTIFDAREYENIFTQYVMLKGKKTATLQHGYYPVFGKIYHDLAIQYTGFVSNQLWTWGDYNKDNAILSGVSKSLVLSVGYPKSFETLNESSIRHGIIGIVLDGGELLRPYNLEMIKIVSSVAITLNYTILLKPHPHDKFDYTRVLDDTIKYEFFYGSIFDYGRRVDYSVCYSSSSYIDLLAMKSIVLRYISRNGTPFYERLSESDSFSSVEELDSIINGPDSRHVNDYNRTLLLGNTDKVKENYNKAARALFY